MQWDCRRVPSTAPTDSSDWRRLRASEEGVSHSHGNMGAAQDAWDSDFRVPGDVKEDDGLEEVVKESSDATDARGGVREPEDAVPQPEETSLGSQSFPKREQDSRRSPGSRRQALSAMSQEGRG
ncbi:hypothetical protein NDU88_003567 [Pleurodeles waltl]|uniref:Uncharacterized protein n=1 Tax=Pleurodeles waltl TaxID=8319 RepID=A0AAV7M502_PLEWA|nr:hypothetical protein NDU88_003567 [Pleurodeles waltl]